MTSLSDHAFKRLVQLVGSSKGTPATEMLSFEDDRERSAETSVGVVLLLLNRVALGCLAQSVASGATTRPACLKHSNGWGGSPRAAGCRSRTCSCCVSAVVAAVH